MVLNIQPISITFYITLHQKPFNIKLILYFHLCTGNILFLTFKIQFTVKNKSFLSFGQTKPYLVTLHSDKF